MVYQNILLETSDRISLLTINRPDKRNALNQLTRDEILHALDTLHASPESRVLVGRETDLFALTFGSEDKVEGVRAFLEKRKPDFKGR